MSMPLSCEPLGMGPPPLVWVLANSPAIAAPSDPASHLPSKGEKQSHDEITPQSLQGTLLALGCDFHPHWPGQR